MRGGLPSSRKVRRAEEALREIDRRSGIARRAVARTHDGLALERYKALEEAARLVRFALGEEP